MYVGVILSKAIPRFDRVYHYSVPQDLEQKVKVGSQVLIPFGKRTTIGYVVEFVDKPEVPKVRDIIEVRGEKPLFNGSAVKLAKWMSDYYFSFFIRALRMLMPPGTILTEKRKTSRRHSALDAESTLSKKAWIPAPVSGHGTSFAGMTPVQASFPLVLTPEQKIAFESVKKSIDENKPETFLLYGITGSGKTEIYMHLVQYLIKGGRNSNEVIPAKAMPTGRQAGIQSSLDSVDSGLHRNDRSAIILVPEVGLTPQLIERFGHRFGNQIAVLHSSLTIKQRREAWQRILSGDVKVVLGTRMAIFAPLPNLGLIILDEEYEITYKQDQNPRYHARTVAEYLSKELNIPVVLGSATPSVESFYKAQKGEYKLLTLSKRIDERPLPPVQIVDMRKEARRGSWMRLGGTLRAELRRTFEAGQQAILFINRTGFFTYVACAECGKKIECPHCAVSLVFHKKDNKLHCSHCDFKMENLAICPNCSSGSMRYFGSGTQRIEQEVTEVFPRARILRLDSNVTSKQGKHEAIYGTFAEGKADVLIGTQLVTKGLDVANVTLVGVVNADSSLNVPDFRAGEHTFQELTQVAGRAGRHHLPGKVIIQTYNPEHSAITAAAKHDYKEFYDEEIKTRQELNYPPFSKLISIIISGKLSDEAESEANVFAKELNSKLEKIEGVSVLGPAAATIAKVRDGYRYHILIKCKSLDDVRPAISETASKINLRSNVRLSLDVEPISLL